MHRWLQRNRRKVTTVLLTTTALVLLQLLVATYAKDLEWYPPLQLVPLSLSNSHKLAGRGSASSIARIVHQSWSSRQLPGRFRQWSQSWRRCFPAWRHILWTDEDNDRFVRTEFAHLYSAWAALPRKIERIDAVRYLYLYRHGGVYADLDTECQRPFEHLLANCSLVLGSMSVSRGWWSHKMPTGLVQNSFMYSRPGHEFWMEAFAELRRRSELRWLHRILGFYPDPEERTGPLMLMWLLGQRWSKYRSSMCVYAPEFFNPFSWQEMPANCLIANRMTQRQLQLCRRHFNGSYVVQYHTQVWKGGRIDA